MRIYVVKKGVTMSDDHKVKQRRIVWTQMYQIRFTTWQLKAEI